MTHRLTVCLSLLALPLLMQAQTLPAARPGQAQLTDCVRELGGDSVALYYDAHYALTPVACATLRRFTHLDEQGNFNGDTRDYQIKDNQLLFRQHYDHGQRQGSYAAYYPNGQCQVRGAFSKGELSGEWQFWYASGQPWQTLRWSGAPQQPWRFVAYWTSEGQQLLANGTGRWQQVIEGQRLRIEGAVANELPEGAWVLYQLPQQKPLTTETYEQGKFKKGHEWVSTGVADYRDKAHLTPKLDDPSVDAERYQLGSTCAERARLDAFIQSEMQKGHFRTARTGQKNLTPARPDGDASIYLGQLLQKLSGMPGMSALLFTPQYTAAVEADIDELGKLSSFRSPQADFQRVFAQLVPPLGRWHAATLEGQPARCHVRFELSVVDQQWRVHYSVRGIEASPPVAPQP